MKIKCLFGKHEYEETRDGAVYLKSMCGKYTVYDFYLVNLKCKHCGKRKTGEVVFPRAIR